MKDLLLVGFGGFLGSIARYAIGGWVLHHTVSWRFPLGTFLVNVAGCAVAGVLGGCVVRYEWFDPEIRLFLFTGLLGGFTTFSAFGLETTYLLRRGEFAVAGAYVVASVIVGLAAAWLGMRLVTWRLP